MIKTITWVAALCFSICANIAYAGWDLIPNRGVDLIVIDPFIQMRTGPGRGYPVFHVIEKGEKLHIFVKRTDWFKVETTKGIKGWVKRSSFVKTLGLEGQLTAFTGPGRQNYLNRQFEFGILTGRFDTADSLTTYGAFHLTQNISGEIKYTQTFSPIANNKLLGFNVVHKPFPTWRISPFFTLGYGQITISPSAALVQPEERKNWLYTVGTGAFVYISRRFLMRIEYNKHTLLTKREANEEVEEWKAGFSVFF